MLRVSLIILSSSTIDFLYILKLWPISSWLCEVTDPARSATRVPRLKVSPAGTPQTAHTRPGDRASQKHKRTFHQFRESHAV